MEEYLSEFKLLRQSGLRNQGLGNYQNQSHSSREAAKSNAKAAKGQVASGCSETMDGTTPQR